MTEKEKNDLLHLLSTVLEKKTAKWKASMHHGSPYKMIENYGCMTGFKKCAELVLKTIKEIKCEQETG